METIETLKNEISRLNSIITVLIDQNKLLKSFNTNLKNYITTNNLIDPVDKIDNGLKNINDSIDKIENNTNYVYDTIERIEKGIIYKFNTIEKLINGEKLKIEVIPEAPCPMKMYSIYISYMLADLKKVFHHKSSYRKKRRVGKELIFLHNSIFTGNARADRVIGSRLYKALSHVA